MKVPFLAESACMPAWVREKRYFITNYKINQTTFHYVLILCYNLVVYVQLGFTLENLHALISGQHYVTLCIHTYVPLPLSLLQLALLELASSAFIQTEGATSTTGYPRLHCLTDLPSSALRRWTRPRQTSCAVLLAINAWFSMTELMSLGLWSTWDS